MPSPSRARRGASMLPPTWEFGEVSLPVLAAVLVIPEVCGLTGDRFGAHQLTALSPDGLPWHMGEH